MNRENSAQTPRATTAGSAVVSALEPTTTQGTTTSSATAQQHSNNNSSSSAWIKNTHVLEGDGVVPHLFNYLYRMDRSMRGRQHAMEGPAQQANATASGSTQDQSAGNANTGNPLDATQGSSAFNVSDLGATAATTTSASGVFAGATPGNGDPTLGATIFTPHSVTGPTASAQLQQQDSPRGTKKGAAAADRGRLMLPIPDTVIYDHNFPQAWFSYSKSPPELVKRPGKFLDAQHIYKRLCKVEQGSGGICAQFSCSVPHPTDPNQPPELKVLYLNPAMLEDLLYSRGTFVNLKKHGLLQKFVPPRGSCNDMIEVVWSPKVTVCRRRVNINSLATRSVSLSHKGATFDGAPYLSLESPANDRVSTELIDLVTMVAENLLKHEHKRVNRLVALFKQDKNCQPWLMHATSVRVEAFDKLSHHHSSHRVPVNLNPIYQKEPTEVPNDYLAEQRKRTVVLNWAAPPKPKDEENGRPRYRFTASALARDGANGGRSSGGFHQRRSAQAIEQRHAQAMELGPRGDRTGGSSGGLAPSSVPPEVKMLETFFEDTFYALYASRMTMGAQAKPAVITVPLQVEHFLGKSQLDYLLVSIMQLRRDKDLEEQRERDMEAIHTAELEAEEFKRRQKEEEEKEQRASSSSAKKDETSAASGNGGSMKMEKSIGEEDEDYDQEDFEGLDADVADEDEVGFTSLQHDDTMAPDPNQTPKQKRRSRTASSASTPAALDPEALKTPQPKPPSDSPAPSSAGPKPRSQRVSAIDISEPADDGGHETVGTPSTTTGSAKKRHSLGAPSKSFAMKKRKGPRIYVSAGAPGSSGNGVTSPAKTTAHHQQHLVPLCKVREECDLFLADIRAKVM